MFDGYSHTQLDRINEHTKAQIFWSDVVCLSQLYPLSIQNTH